MAETFSQRLKRVSEGQKTTLVVSQDEFRVDEHGVYRHDRDLEDQIKSRAKATFREILSRGDIRRAVLLVGVPGAGKSTWIAQNREPGVVYFDATLTTPKARHKLIHIAKRLEKPIEAVVLATPLEVCGRRNSKRPRGRRVPWKTVLEMAENLVKTPPTLGEGLSRVLIIEPVSEAPESA